jgi:uncharacterized beta-barrel protein YwiB (DUF1934 family)
MSKIPVMLAIQGKQFYDEQEPDVIELVTEGTMELDKQVWEIAYEESDLTGLAGVTTVFRVGPRGVSLKRTGRLQSQMIFREGVRHESLYQMEFGALMIAVQAQKIRHSLSEQGGTVDLTYAIEIENSAAGTVEYHLDIKAIK